MGNPGADALLQRECSDFPHCIKGFPFSKLAAPAVRMRECICSTLVYNMVPF